MRMLETSQGTRSKPGTEGDMGLHILADEGGYPGKQEKESLLAEADPGSAAAAASSICEQIPTARFSRFLPNYFCWQHHLTTCPYVNNYTLWLLSFLLDCLK